MTRDLLFSYLVKLANFLFSASLAAAVIGCSDDEDQTQPVTLTFAATVAGAPVSCSTMYSGLGTTNANAQLADARFFIYDVELRTPGPDGIWQSVDLDTNPWQSSGVALLDFEDGSGTCAASGTADTNATVSGRVFKGTYDGVRFRVGVPFELNHNDNATQPSPFNVPGMFWNWRGGYKFVRIDWAVDGGVVPRWNVHIGSTGCPMGLPTTPSETPCGRTNVATIELTGLNPQAESIDVDLAALVSAADLTANTMDTPTGCQSNPMEPDDCRMVMDSLGLSFETGACVDNCGGQAVFQ